MEKWKEHPVYTGYWVSDQGRVRGKYGRILSDFPSSNKQYRCVAIHHNKIQSTKFVHELVLETFVGLRPEGKVCRHGPLGSLCNSVKNLCWGLWRKTTEKIRKGTAHYLVEKNTEVPAYRPMIYWLLRTGGRQEKLRFPLPRITTCLFSTSQLFV